MAVLVLGTNAVAVYNDGQAGRTTLYALRHVAAGDTIDLSADFNPPICGALIGVAGAAAGGSVVMAAPAGNVITIPAGPSNSAGLLLVFGVHA